MPYPTRLDDGSRLRRQRCLDGEMSSAHLRPRCVGLFNIYLQLSRKELYLYRKCRSDRSASLAQLHFFLWWLHQVADIFLVFMFHAKSQSNCLSVLKCTRRLGRTQHQARLSSTALQTCIKLKELDFSSSHSAQSFTLVEPFTPFLLR